MVKYEYDAWGNHTVSGIYTDLGKLNPFRYRSYFYDTETQLYYLKSRYYDPYIGRFISMDDASYADPETVGGLNLYAYCGNNPVMNVDYNGHFAISIGVAFGLAGLALIALIEATLHPIQNAAETIGDAVAELVDNIQIDNFAKNNELYNNYYYAKKRKPKYTPKQRGVRVRGKSKKDAYEKAKKRGGGKEPIFHKGKYSKYGKWIGRHFHPGVPENHPYFHDHYFYLLLFLLGIEFEE